MSLKTRFVLLVVGSVLIPNIIIMIIVGFSFGGFSNIRALHRQMKIDDTITGMIRNPVQQQDLVSYLASASSSVDYYLYSGTREFIASSTGTNDLWKALERERRFTARGFTLVGKGRAILFLHLPALEHFTRVNQTPFPFIGLLVLLSVLSLLSLLVIRSINSSLKRIEEATRQVAEGNYDFELPVKGNDSIASLSRSFNSMIERVREEYSRRSRFFMGVSHDLKTPLASISGYADAILEGYADSKETLDRYAGIIKDKSGLLLDRIYHLIEFVKLETGEWKVSFQDVPLKRFLSEMADTAAVDAEVYHYGFESEILVGERTMVSMDAGLVRRSFDNIVHNAFRYAEKGTTISIKAEERDGYVTVAISNRGKGIPKEDLQYIFEPFYRGSATRNEDGFGLGLANVASVITSHGWNIDVDSVPDETTTFTIRIPVSISTSPL